MQLPAALETDNTHDGGNDHQVYISFFAGLRTEKLRDGHKTKKHGVVFLTGHVTTSNNRVIGTVDPAGLWPSTPHPGHRAFS